MKRTFALFLTAAMLFVFAAPAAAAGANYKVVDISQSGYLKDDGDLDLSETVSRVPYGESVYFPLLSGGNSSAVSDAEKAYNDANKKYEDAQERLSKAIKAVTDADQKVTDTKAAYDAAQKGDTTELAKAWETAKTNLANAKDAQKTAEGKRDLGRTEVTNSEGALKEKQAALSGLVPADTIEKYKTAMDNAQTEHTKAIAEEVRLAGVETTTKAEYDRLYKLDSGNEATAAAFKVWDTARVTHKTYKEVTLLAKLLTYTTNKATYDGAVEKNAALNKAVTDAQNRLDAAKIELPKLETAVTEAVALVGTRTTEEKAAKEALDNGKPDGEKVKELKKAWDDAVLEQTKAVAEKGLADADVKAAPTKAAVDALKKTWNDLKSSSFKYVHESSAAGEASVKADWEDDSKRYVGTPTVKRVRVRSSDAKNFPSNYIYCLEIPINTRSVSDNREIFGQITIKQTKGDKENRFENVELDLAIEIGYKNSTDTDVGEGVIPEKPATFKKGQGFEQDSEFEFSFEADGSSKFVVNTIGQGTITLGFTTDPIEKIDNKIYKEYPGATVDYFTGNYASFNKTGTLYLAPHDGEDNYYVYAVDDRGNISRASATWESSEDAYAIKTRTLGRYFLSSQRLSNSFLTTGSSGSGSSGSGSGSSGSGSGNDDLVIVPGVPSASSTPAASRPASSTPASSSRPASSAPASSKTESSKPESSDPDRSSSEEVSEPEEETSEPEEIIDVDTETENTDGPKKGISTLVWVLIIVGGLAAAGGVGFVLYNAKVKRDEYSEYDEYEDDDFPDDNDDGK